MIKVYNSRLYYHPKDLKLGELKMSRVIIPLGTASSIPLLINKIRHYATKIESIYIGNVGNSPLNYDPTKDFENSIKEYEVEIFLFSESINVFFEKNEEGLMFNFHIYLTEVDDALILRNKEDVFFIFELVNFFHSVK